MKNILFTFLLLSTILLSGCEKVIDVKLNSEEARLVVDAALTWIKGTDGKNQSIFLSTITGYDNLETPKVSGATVYVDNSTNTRFNFLEDVDQKGKYVCNNFIPVIGETYTLTIIYQGETYKAQEKLQAVNPIIDVEQRSDLGINRDEYGIRVNFQDPSPENNFYVLNYVTNSRAFPYFDAFDDLFFQGNIGFGLFSSDKLKKDDAISIKLNGASERYFNYIKKLIKTTNSGGPFQPAPVSTIRGNIINQTTESNFCLGYFSICEADEMVYILK